VYTCLGSGTVPLVEGTSANLTIIILVSSRHCKKHVTTLSNVYYLLLISSSSFSSGDLTIIILVSTIYRYSVLSYKNNKLLHMPFVLLLLLLRKRSSGGIHRWLQRPDKSDRVHRHCVRTLFG
jgi:hypothetical protein